MNTGCDDSPSCLPLNNKRTTEFSLSTTLCEWIRECPSFYSGKAIKCEIRYVQTK